MKSLNIPTAEIMQALELNPSGKKFPLCDLVHLYIIPLDESGLNCSISGQPPVRMDAILFAVNSIHWNETIHSRHNRHAVEKEIRDKTSRILAKITEHNLAISPDNIRKQQAFNAVKLNYEE